MDGVRSESNNDTGLKNDVKIESPRLGDSQVPLCTEVNSLLRGPSLKGV